MFLLISRCIVGLSFVFIDVAHGLNGTSTFNYTSAPIFHCGVLTGSDVTQAATLGVSSDAPMLLNNTVSAFRNSSYFLTSSGMPL